MLSLDIETTGLDRYNPHHALTMVCACDHAAEYSFPFLLCVDPHTGAVTDVEKYQSLKEGVVRLLDEAVVICAYNGIEFDIPFLCHKLSLTSAKQAQWATKTVDLLYYTKHLFNKMFKLQTLLMCNGLQHKSANGMQAIVWAKSNQVEPLQEYCLLDTKLTLQLMQLDYIIFPFKIKDQTVIWSHGSFGLLQHT
jgi:hypothetical protein